MFARQTKIAQLLLLCCIIIQSCLLHKAGSSLIRLKAESEPLSKNATTVDEDDYETSWTRDTTASSIENNKSSGCRQRCQSERSNRSKDQKANTVEYILVILGRRKERSVESEDQVDCAQGEISRATDERDRPLEEKVGHFLDDLDGRTTDSEDDNAPDTPPNEEVPATPPNEKVPVTAPNEEVPVEINCNEVLVGSNDFWECFRRTLP